MGNSIRSDVSRLIAFHGQLRKYSGEPYVLHCLEVARMAADVDGMPP